MLLAAAAILAGCSDVPGPIEPGADLAPLHPAFGRNAVQGSYIVVLKEGANPRSVAAIMGIAPALVYDAAISGFAAEITNGQLNALRRNPNVAYVEVDRVVALAPPCGTPNGGPCPPDDPDGGAQATPWGVARVGGPIAGATGTAWVIDTGVDLDHPDLNVDVARSASFVPRGKSGADDGNGHGTHVAGTIAAIDNGIDVVGVAAGAKVASVRVLDNSGSGAYSWIIAGVDYVARNGRNGDVANMSLGGPPSQALDDAVRAASASVKFTLAAGNSDDDAGDYSPARVNGANIYTISAIGSNNCLASFSNWGNPPVDFAEPGVSILSTKRGGGTTTMSGTSMAAPHAAGLLLVGGIRSGGSACNDPDGDADTIGVH
jgi:subtilisin family serine protease